jgi:hypothetical protein
MMKFDKTIKLASISALIVFSTMSYAASSDYNFPTSASLSAIGADAGKAIVAGSKRAAVGNADSLEEAVSALEADLEQQGIATKASEEEEGLRGKIKNWTDKIGKLGQIESLFGKKKQSDAKKREKDLKKSAAEVAKLPSQAAAASNFNFNLPADATKSCTKGVDVTGLQQEATNFMTGPVKRMSDAVVSLVNAEGKKAVKVAEKEFFASIAAAKKDVEKQEDPAITEILNSEFPFGADQTTWDERKKFLEAVNKSKKNEHAKAAIALNEKIGPGLIKAKTDKALMAQVTADYAADWEKIRQGFETKAVSSAQAGHKNCTVLAAQAGSSLFQSEKDQQQSALGAAASPFAQLASQLGGAVAQTFPPSSAAARAMDFLTIGYRGSLNMVPVITQYSGMISNMVNQLQCTDKTPQVQQLVGQPLKNVIADVTSADEKTLGTKVRAINDAMAGAMNQVQLLFNNPSDPDNTVTGSCEIAQDTKRQLDQFATTVSGAAANSQQRGGARGGAVNPAIHQQPQG